MKSKKIVSLILILSLVISIAPVHNVTGVVNATGTTYTRTYTQMVDYNYGEKNEGFYLDPGKPGKYPVIFMFHGAGQNSSSNWEYRSYLMDMNMNTAENGS